jgi:hypothetical protein
MANMQRKINVTDQVKIKLDNGKLVFSLGSQVIGEMRVSDEELALSPTYQLESGQLYQLTAKPATSTADSYVEHCDLGWC